MVATPPGPVPGGVAFCLWTRGAQRKVLPRLYPAWGGLAGVSCWASSTAASTPPSRPQGQHRRRELGQLHAGRPTRPVPDRVVPHHQRPRHARRGHHRGRPQRRWHRRGGFQRADGGRQGGQRRRLHLPGVRRLRVRLGGPEEDGRHQQQLLRRPVRVLLRGPARPVRRQGGRAPRGGLVDRPGRRPRGRRRQLRARPGRHVLVQRHRQPGRQQPARTLNSGGNDIPTELPGVVTVSSVQRFPAGTLDFRLSNFSNRGLGVIDVAAPGTSILSTVVANNGYGTKSGTSMASPRPTAARSAMARSPTTATSVRAWSTPSTP